MSTRHRPTRWRLAMQWPRLALQATRVRQLWPTCRPTNQCPTRYVRTVQLFPRPSRCHSRLRAHRGQRRSARQYRLQVRRACGDTAHGARARTSQRSHRSRCGCPGVPFPLPTISPNLDPLRGAALALRFRCSLARANCASVLTPPCPPRGSTLGGEPGTFVANTGPVRTTEQSLLELDCVLGRRTTDLRRRTTDLRRRTRSRMDYEPPRDSKLGTEVRSPKAEIRDPRSEAPRSEIRDPRPEAPRSEIRDPRPEAPRSEIR